MWYSKLETYMNSILKSSNDDGYSFDMHMFDGKGSSKVVYRIYQIHLKDHMISKTLLEYFTKNVLPFLVLYSDEFKYEYYYHEYTEEERFWDDSIRLTVSKM